MKKEQKRGFRARQPKVTREHYLQSFTGLLLVRLGHMHAFISPMVKHYLAFKTHLKCQICSNNCFRLIFSPKNC